MPQVSLLIGAALTSAYDGDVERVLLSKPEVGQAEREALLRAFDSGWIAPLGPEVDAFELELAAYVRGRSCVALASGTAGLRLAMLAIGVKPGDEVVVQSATFAATAFAVAHIGAKPVFCDSDTTSWNLDPELLNELLAERAATGSLPAAVIPVDLYGMMADYDRLAAVCGRYGVPVVADAAEALGSIGLNGEMAGRQGAVGCVSFNGNKIITTSGGGAIFAEPDLADRIRYLATQAREPVLHYEHNSIGYNDRLSNLLAAVGRAQLTSLEAKIEARTKINQFYRSSLPQLEWMPDAHTSRPNYWLSVGLLPEGFVVGDVCEELNQVGIEARPAWKPMHLQPVFADAIAVGGSVSKHIFRQGICLPSGAGLTDSELDRVVTQLDQILNA